MRLESRHPNPSLRDGGKQNVEERLGRDVKNDSVWTPLDQPMSPAWETGPLRRRVRVLRTVQVKFCHEVQAGVKEVSGPRNSVLRVGAKSGGKGLWDVYSEALDRATLLNSPLGSWCVGERSDKVQGCPGPEWPEVSIRLAQT